MANLDNLGYNTFVLGTIRAVTECKKILVYNKNSFIGNQNYSRLNLYNLEDIFFSVLYNENTRTYNENCLILERDLPDPSEAQNVFFEYDCNNPITTNGFNVIIYMSSEDTPTPTGYTEFMNPQGLVSNYIRIFLKFRIEINQIELELNNSLYKVKNRLSKDFIGTSLNEYPSSQNIKNKIDRLPKDLYYTSHLSSFLDNYNKSNVYLGDRTLLHTKSTVSLGFIKDINIFDGENYDDYQIGYYKDDIVIYSWAIVNDSIGFYYRITSLLTQDDYKYTRLEGGEYIDTVSRYSDREISKTILYCSGKYLVFKVNFRTSSIVALFDTSIDKWISSNSPNIVVDPLDKTSKIYELPKSTTIQDYDSAIELLPSLANTYLDLKDYIQEHRNLDIAKKFGDWFFIKSDNIYIATCISFSVYMTQEEYKNCIVVNNNTLLIKGENYYTIYHGTRQKTYYTEKVRCLMSNTPLTSYEFGDGEIFVCQDENLNTYLDYYKKSEIAIIYKSDLIYNNLLNSYRRQPLYTYKVPDNIIGAIGSIIFYINQNSNINYI